MKKYNRMPLVVTNTGYYSFTHQFTGKSKLSMKQNPVIPNQSRPQPQGPGPVIYPSNQSNEKKLRVYKICL